jgi:hypothetical protein
MTPREMAEASQRNLAFAEAHVRTNAWGSAQVYAQIGLGYASLLQALLTQGPWPGEVTDG